MSLVYKGRAWVFGDNIQNDEGLMPLEMTRNQIYDPAALAKRCFEQIDPDFAARARPSDIVVAGRNFGLGNPHIQGFLGLFGLGVGILAESMSRGPLRACVNAGVPILTPVEGIGGVIEQGDALEVDFETGEIRNVTRGEVIRTAPLPPVMKEIVQAGGGVAYMMKRLGKTESQSSR